MLDPLFSTDSEQVETLFVRTVRRFIDQDVKPVARTLEHSNEYPDQLIQMMKRLGIFGLVIPEPYGEAAVSTSCFAHVTRELARGWMSLAGAMGGHSVVADLIVRYGTDSQRAKYLPAMATGEIRAAMALTEPSGGSDLQAMRTTAIQENGEFVINGSKAWITNARHAQVIALLCKTDPAAVPAHTGMSILLIQAGEGFTISRDLPKLGYKGVESCELFFDDFHQPVSCVLGGEVGAGFVQMAKGLELGRIQVAARAVGVGYAALEDALRYGKEREAFGQPIWRHQSISNYLADMATKLLAADQLIDYACRRRDLGKRCDMEAGMAKLFASEVAMEVSLSALRIHGGNGYSTELDVERYFRDAPLMIIGEGTNEIQRNLITRQLTERGVPDPFELS